MEGNGKGMEMKWFPEMKMPRILKVILGTSAHSFCEQSSYIYLVTFSFYLLDALDGAGHGSYTTTI